MCSSDLKGEILRYAGVYGADSDIESLVDDCIREVSGRLRYKVVYTVLPVISDEEGISLGNIRSSSRSMIKALCGCSYCAVFAATVGIEMDRLIARYSAISPTRSLIFSAIGTERIESLCNAFCDQLGQEMADAGHKIRPRFSAGYGDIPLELQKNIFELLDCQRRIGLTLNESLLISPTKSVTAFVGITV